MKILFESRAQRWLIILGASTVTLALVFQAYLLKTQRTALEEQIFFLREEIALLQANYASTTDTLGIFQKKFELTKVERDLIEQNLRNEQTKVGDITNQVESLSGTVKTLTKYIATDKQLLAKYSKTYFLNENYSPERLMQIDVPYKYSLRKEVWLQSDMWPFLKNMLDDARAQGIDMQVFSAYRSFDTQAGLKASYKITYGAGTANQFSADQGYSEHQLGTAVDFTTTKIGDALASFEKTTTYSWLVGNAHKYGFILSYPKNNEYYKFESWHWRFVGVALATKLYQENKNFYTLDQREIDTYLINLFDPI